MTSNSYLSPHVKKLIARSRDGFPAVHEELLLALSVPPGSPESFAIIAEARRVSMEVSDGMAEVHGQFAVNLAPCPINCTYCAFAERTGVFTESWEIDPDEAAVKALEMEVAGANAIYLMATDNFPLERYLEIAQEVRRCIHPTTVLTANVGDVSRSEAQAIRDAGFSAATHSLRLREGVDTNIPPEIRKRSIRNFQEAGIAVGLSVSPVGPEHTVEELAALHDIISATQPAYGGLCRRITVPGSPLAQHGKISDLLKAHYLAVIRLGLPRSVRAICTHEPDALSVAAGANVLFAERGANPRDTNVETEKSRGWSVTQCRALLTDAEWSILEGPSMFFQFNIHEGVTR